MSKICPLPHEVPFATLLQLDAFVFGEQTWHPFAGLGAAGAKTIPPMKHPAPQAPDEHTSPVPQLTPLERLLHAVVLVAGWQLWHAFAGFGVPVE